VTRLSELTVLLVKKTLWYSILNSRGSFKSTGLIERLVLTFSRRLAAIGPVMTIGPCQFQVRTPLGCQLISKKMARTFKSLFFDACLAVT